PLRGEAFDDGEERAVDVEAVRLGCDAVADRMLRVDLDPQDRPRREMLIARQPFLQVAHRNRQPVNREIACAAHRDERAAVGDELLQALDARLADPAAILGTYRARLVAVDDAPRILIGEDGSVELLPELAAASVGVVDRRETELVLLERPARPPLVHVAAGPRLIHRDPGRPERNSAVRFKVPS